MADLDAMTEHDDQQVIKEMMENEEFMYQLGILPPEDMEKEHLKRGFRARNAAKMDTTYNEHVKRTFDELPVVSKASFNKFTKDLLAEDTFERGLLVKAITLFEQQQGRPTDMYWYQFRCAVYTREKHTA